MRHAPCFKMLRRVAAPVVVAPRHGAREHAAVVKDVIGPSFFALVPTSLDGRLGRCREEAVWLPPGRANILADHHNHGRRGGR